MISLLKILKSYHFSLSAIPFRLRVYLMYNSSLTQGDSSRINALSGNRTSAPVQALDNKSNLLPLGYRACTNH